MTAILYDSAKTEVGVFEYLGITYYCQVLDSEVENDPILVEPKSKMKVPGVVLEKEREFEEERNE